MQKPLSERSIQCPSCGGHTELKNRFVKLVVCGYCSQSLSMTGDGPVAQGKVAQLADLFTDLSLGAFGSIDGRSFAEMTDAEKHAISHRARAFQMLKGRLGGG